ncbi:MAG TPA: NAD(P)-dependent oxidoreductase [Roseiflexaceae bacterium]|nr:NAD(P)-dependent oxidoreductase [Roseiflexaceae bacterium]
MNVLITGGAGHIASLYRAHVGSRHRLRLLDMRPIDQAPGQESLVGRLDDLEAVRSACAGMEMVIHLGADRNSEAPFMESLLANNYIATHNVFTAAHEARCKRVIFASSTHTTGALPIDRRNITEDEQAPGNLYGVSKLYGESLASYFAHVHGLSAICLRFGWVAPPLEHMRAVRDSWWTAAYLGPRDLCQLLDLCLASDLRYAVLNASSDNLSNRLDLRRTRALLGYEPRERVEDLL